MTQAVAQIFAEAERLSAEEQIELTDLLVEKLAHEEVSELGAEQMAAVRRRAEEVQSGRAVLISGEEVFARMERLISSFPSAS